MTILSVDKYASSSVVYPVTALLMTSQKKMRVRDQRWSDDPYRILLDCWSLFLFIDLKKRYEGSEVPFSRKMCCSQDHQVNLKGKYADRRRE